MTSSRDLAQHAVTAAIDNSALEPVLVDVSQTSSYTDYVLILSGRSMRQVEALVETLRLSLKTLDEHPLGVEGERDGHWMLLDYGNLVVHVFYHPMREFYDLEGLWADANKVDVKVPPELRVACY